MKATKPLSFDLNWLDLREPADNAAQNADVLGALIRHFVSFKTIDIVDLGAGSGSCFRKLSPQLPQVQTWLLVDGDERLLDVAMERCRSLAGEMKGRTASVSVRTENIAACLAACIRPNTNLVTLAAFLDLASERFVEEFADVLVARSLPVYATLNYSGVERWKPPHVMDEAVLGAFLAHQRSDKGFGNALGPEAADCFERALRKRGYDVHSGPSDWSLDRDHAPLIVRLAKGIAAAVGETERIDPVDLAGWLAARLQSRAATIGHTDIFAAPRA